MEKDHDANDAEILEYRMQPIYNDSPHKDEIEEAPRIQSPRSNDVQLPKKTPRGDLSTEPHDSERQFKPLSILVRVLIASFIMAFCAGISWGYPGLKNDLSQLGIFGRSCHAPETPPCEDQILNLNLMFQITVSGGQVLSVVSGLYFQIFERRIYLFTVGVLFTLSVCGFGVGLLLKDVPILSEALYFVCYFLIGFSGLSILMGFLSYQRDVPGRWKSVVSTFVNAPFDLGTAIFLLASVIVNHTPIPLWLLFVVYGLFFGSVICIFSIFMNPRKKKPKRVAPTNEEEEGIVGEQVTPQDGSAKVRNDSIDEESASIENDIELTESSPPMRYEGSVKPIMDEEPQTTPPAIAKPRRTFKQLLWRTFTSIRKYIPLSMYLQPEVIVFHVLDTILVSQLNFYSATVLEQMTWVSGSEEQGLEVSNVFNIIQPFIGTVISILIGPFLSSFHPTVGVVLVLCSCFTYSLLSLFRVVWLQYLTFVFMFCTRALYFILLGMLVYTVFPVEHAPFIYSSILTFSGVFGVLLGHLANYLAIKVFEGSFFIVNLVYGASSVALLLVYFVAVLRLHRKNKRREKERQDEIKEVEIPDSKEPSESSSAMGRIHTPIVIWENTPIVDEPEVSFDVPESITVEDVV